MAIENVKKFEGVLKCDDSMIAEINKAAEEYTGDRADENAVFDAILAPILNEKGIPFTFDELVEYKTSLGELSEDELANVAGGGGCFVLGFTSEPEAVIDGAKSHVCAFIGVGF